MILRKITTSCFIVITGFLYSQEYKADYLFLDVSIVSMNEGAVGNQMNMAIKDGKIITIDSNFSSLPKAKKTISLKNHFITPGLSDAHVHLPREEEEFRKNLILNLINGVTKLRSMRGVWEHFSLKEKYNAPNSIYPKIYLSPPPVSRKVDMSSEQINDYVKKAKQNGCDFIKVLSVSDEKFFQELNNACERNNITMAGHFIRNVSDSIFFKSEYKSIEHLGGLITDENIILSRIEEIKANDISICPTFQWHHIGYGQLSLDNMIEARGMEYIDLNQKTKWENEFKDYIKKLGWKKFDEEVKKFSKEMEMRYKILFLLNKKGINLLLSPDTSSMFTVSGYAVLEEMRHYKKAGLTNYDILKSATTNFANYFNDQTSGTIEVGKVADFLITKKNPLLDLGALEEINGVFINGNYLDSDRLKKLSKEILPN